MKLFAANLLVLSCAFAQVAENANKNYKTSEGRAAVAKTLIAPDRDARQKPVELVQAMGLKPGMVVADIGTSETWAASNRRSIPAPPRAA